MGPGDVFHEVCGESVRVNVEQVSVVAVLPQEKSDFPLPG